MNRSILRPLCQLSLLFAASSLAVACGDDSGAGGSGGSGTTTGSTTTSATTSGVTTGATTSTGVVDAAPGPVTDFAAAANGGDIDLSWTNPADADLAGVVIVRGEGVPVTFAPVDGTSYTEGMAAGTGQEVLFVGAGTAATLTAGTPGVAYNFSAWAVDAAGQYSVVAETSGSVVQLGAQAGQIEIALNGTVTVTQQPANLTIGGTATVNLGAGTIDLDLTAQNDTGRLIFNLKSLTDNISDGDLAGPTFPTGIGLPSTYYGPEALDSAAQVTRTVSITNISGAVDPIVLDVHFVDAPMLFSQDASGSTPRLQLADSSGSENSASIVYPDQNTFYNSLRTGAISADGRRIFAGHKSQAVVVSYDTTTLAPTVSADLSTGGLGSVGGVQIGADGTVYALVNDGAHWYGSDSLGSGNIAAASSVSLVKLDPVTLAVTATLPLVTAGTNGEVGRTLKMAPNGGRIVAALGAGGRSSTDPGKLHFVDIATFTEIDTDPGMAGTQPVTLAEARVADVAGVGNQLLVAFDTPVTQDQVQIVNLTTYVTTLQPVNATDNRISATVAAGGRVFMARRNRNGGTIPLTVLDPVGMTETLLDPGFTQVRGFVVSADGDRYYAWSSGEVAAFDAATDMQLDVDGDAGNGITNFSIPSADRHFMLISPF